MKHTQESVNHVARDFAGKCNMTLGRAVDVILKQYEETVERRAIERTMLKLADEYFYVEHTHPQWKTLDRAATTRSSQGMLGPANRPFVRYLSRGIIKQ